MENQSSSTDSDTSSMFMQKYERRARARSATRTNISPRSQSSSPLKQEETITVKDFFDFMKTAYQVYENLEGDTDDDCKVNWEELTKLTVINHVIEQIDRDLLMQTATALPQPVVSKSDSAIQQCEKDLVSKIGKRLSCSQIEGLRSTPSNLKVEMLGVWTEANLNCKLNDIINEGILDSILPYLVGYKKPTKTTSLYTPIIKKTSVNNVDVKKLASFGAFVNEKESRDRLGRRKSSVIAAQERANQKQEGEVEIHVCDEVKGMKKDFRCPQKLLISKMGYFADVTAGQRLEDMDISVHCDIQIFDWLMRWVKRDTILVEDWPLLNPHNVIPILVSASFLQMEPLLHDCLIYCHAHMSEIVKTSTNLACLSDAMLTRLAAMYTNVELEGIKDRKDKMQSRLYCKMILSLAEPVPETLRGHYATLATLFKCSKCNKLLGRHIAELVPCQPANMRIDRRGNLLSTHVKDPSWSLNEYITWLYGELRSWRRVYWRLWADCHFLKCQLCDSYFPAYQMEWCSYHAQPAHMFALESRTVLPTGRYPCCGERAYRFETITRNTGCQFREHAPDEQRPTDAAIMEVYHKFRDMIAMRPPQLMFPERVTRLVARDPGLENGRLECKEVFWWEGLQLVPPRPPLGMLGKLYTSNNKFNQSARPGSPTVMAPQSSQSLGTTAAPAAGPCVSDTETRHREGRPHTANVVSTRKLKKKGTSGGGDSGSEDRLSSSESEQSSASERSDEDAPPKRQQRIPVQHSRHSIRPSRTSGRQWVMSVSARSNQDAQRRFEERAVRQMRAALVRRSVAPTHKQAGLSGGIYARLEAEWRERVGCGGGGGGAAGGGPGGRARTPANRPRNPPPPPPKTVK